MAGSCGSAFEESSPTPNSTVSLWINAGVWTGHELNIVAFAPFSCLVIFPHITN